MRSIIENENAATNPTPGDFWWEMLCPTCVVISVFKTHVIICKSTKEVDREHWTWDLSKLESMTRADFKKWLQYGNIDVYWADIAPSKHTWVLEELRGKRRIKNEHPGEAEEISNGISIEDSAGKSE